MPSSARMWRGKSAALKVMMASAWPAMATASTCTSLGSGSSRRASISGRSRRQARGEAGRRRGGAPSACPCGRGPRFGLGRVMGGGGRGGGLVLGAGGRAGAGEGGAQQGGVAFGLHLCQRPEFGRGQNPFAQDAVGPERLRPPPPPPAPPA